MTDVQPQLPAAWIRTLHGDWLRAEVIGMIGIDETPALHADSAITPWRVQVQTTMPADDGYWTISRHATDEEALEAAEALVRTLSVAPPPPATFLGSWSATGRPT